jgi:hypothetical protein
MPGERRENRCRRIERLDPLYDTRSANSGVIPKRHPASSKQVSDRRPEED